MVSDSFQGGFAPAPNATFASPLPPLPTYAEQRLPSLLPFITDFWLSVVAPIVVYWVVSLFFHAVDTLDLWPQHRLHTPEEILRRNRASRYEVARDVVIQQVIQMISGAFLSWWEPQQMMGREDHDVAAWATRVRLAQRALPRVIGALGLNATALSENVAGSHPLIAGALAGGHYPFLTTELAGAGGVVPAFAGWEVLVAKAMYWLVVPGLQLFVAVTILDTWQYFLHRLMHTNKWLYSRCPPVIPGRTNVD
ncbi:hypothetical protein IMZ48_29925 [Candidatus Bathyarchaeota archaeon]|nr:hypothetical protein [Candidatus Bathyarchaeota archaeon]